MDLLFGRPSKRDNFPSFDVLLVVATGISLGADIVVDHVGGDNEDSFLRDVIGGGGGDNDSEDDSAMLSLRCR